MTYPDPFQSATELNSSGRSYRYHRLSALEDAGIGKLARLPYSIRVLLESALRNLDGFIVEEKHVHALAKWSPAT
ncbi:MAG: hypothetical protein QF412_15080, partial [Planctomycetota bacterium]|nr:hypothetical protein [Planctomycetota bacterium]